MSRFRDRSAAARKSILEGTRAGFGYLARNTDVLVAGVWFVATLWVTLWMWGLKPVVFPTPDEPANRLGALLVRRTGSPVFKLPFADPEDLAHMRPWRSIGDRAFPLYPPVTFYVYGLLTRLGKTGYFLIAMLPATATAAFAAGTAQLLPPRRRWLGILAPALGFPGLYWLLRPWMNISLLLVFLCWALFFWGGWRRFGRRWWLAAALFSVGAAAAVRPDYAAYLMSTALLFSLAASPRDWKRIFSFAIAAGAAALAVNLILNKVVMGDPWRTGYHMVTARKPGESSGGALQLVRMLLFPGGLPTASDAFGWFDRYWLKMGPIVALLVAQLSLLPLLRAQAWPGRVLYSAGLLVVLLFALTRMYGGFYGAMEPVGLVNHSMPRYWAPVYLFAALPPILFLGHCTARSVLFVGSALAFSLAGLSLTEIYITQPTSLSYIEHYVAMKTRWLDIAARTIPANGIVYSEKDDRLVWSRWQVGLITTPLATVASIKRALETGRPVFILKQHFPRTDRGLERALKQEGLGFVRVDARSGIFRIKTPRRKA